VQLLPDRSTLIEIVVVLSWSPIATVAQIPPPLIITLSATCVGVVHREF
jgi:hypothetical protein